MRFILIAAFIFISIMCWANTYTVGENKDYVSPNALYTANVVSDGDTILIDPIEYLGMDCLAVWQQDNLVFIGGGDGIVKATFKAEGEYIWGKGIWVIAGNNTEVHNIEFYGAQVPDKNGAGIRLDGGSLFVNNCDFFFNEMGILSNSSPGTIRVEYCRFAYNGYGDGYSHNIYVNHMDTFIFRYNESHHAVIGHTLKSRARANFIEYNLFYDGDDGNSSRLIDLPNGGFSVVMGNILIQGPSAENNNLVGFGLEGLYDSVINSLYFINNTLINEKTTTGRFLHVQEGSENIYIANNIFAGIGQLIDGSSTEEYSNIINSDIDYFEFIINQDGKVYSVAPTSPAVNSGTELAPLTNYSLTPDQQFHLGPSSTPRSILDNKIDVGAYEIAGPVNTSISRYETFEIYPNPVNEFIHIKSNTNVQAIEIISSEGKLIKNYNDVTIINLSELSPGAYFIKLINHDGTQTMKKFVKL